MSPPGRRAPRIALATYDRAPALPPDDRLIPPALRALGIDAQPAVWSDGGVSWETFDAVLIRSCWDYHLRSGEFRAWLDRLDAAGVPAWNSTSLVRWNADKRYLLDLAARGVPTLPTVVLPRGTSDPAAAAADRGWTRFVLKPAVSASGYETHALHLPIEPAGRAAADRVLALGDALVQPFADEVPAIGELSFIFLNGRPSHAALKRAAPGEFRVQTEHGGSVEPVDAEPALVEQAARVLDAVDEPPLYARVDGIVVGGHQFVLMELELIEPNLFLALAPDAPARLAAAIARRLGVA